MIQNDSKLAQALAGGGWKICLFAPLGGLWNVFKELQSKTKHSVTALLLEDGISLKNIFILLEIWVAPFVIKYPLSILPYILWYTFIVRGFLKELFSSVQLLSRVWLFSTPRAAAHQASVSITNCQKSCLSIWWCHSTFSSSVLSFSSHLQFFPGPGSFPII